MTAGLATREAPATERERIDDAAALVRARFGRRPQVALILGTGLGGLAERIDVDATIDYAELPGFPRSTVETHAGRLLCGVLAGVPVVAMQGRAHRYEGHALRDIALPVRVLRALGADVLVVSNACGGMHPLWAPGDVMLIADHLNLIGGSALAGHNDDALGPRFPDMSAVYDAELRAIARDVAVRRGLTLREGVYAAWMGPSLETRAEYRMLRALGADVVGMSTVPEATAAVHAGMRVLGLSIITDQCLPDALEPVELERIIAVARGAEPALADIVCGVLERL